MKEANNELLTTMNHKMIPGFLDDKHTEREVFSLFYETKARLKLSSDLIILSDTGELLFSTNRNHQESILSPYYLKLLIQNPSQDKVTEKLHFLQTSNTTHSLSNHYFKTNKLRPILLRS